MYFTTFFLKKARYSFGFNFIFIWCKTRGELTIQGAANVSLNLRDSIVNAGEMAEGSEDTGEHQNLSHPWPYLEVCEFVGSKTGACGANFSVHLVFKNSPSNNAFLWSFVNFSLWTLPFPNYVPLAGIFPACSFTFLCHLPVHASTDLIPFT